MDVWTGQISTISWNVEVLNFTNANAKVQLGLKWLIIMKPEFICFVHNLNQTPLNKVSFKPF